MTLVALTFIAFGIIDLMRGDRPLRCPRACAAIVLAVAAMAALARLAGTSWSTIALLALAHAVALILWVILDASAGSRVDASSGPRPLAVAALVWLLGAVLASFAASGAVASVSGPLEDWFSNLPVHDRRDSPTPDRFLVAAGAAVFLLATGNRIVRLVLTVAQTPLDRAESRLRGGRLIGPMERLLIGFMMVAQEPAGIAIVIAAKGLLRLPEIQKAESSAAADEITEYILIGTLASMLVGIAASAAVLAIPS